MFDKIPPDVANAVAGTAGSLTAMLWIKDTLARKAGMLLGGAALSYYGSPALAAWLGLQVGLCGFLLGLFGMAVVNKIMVTWEVLDLSDMVTKALRKLLRLEA
jgi:hypothetical protein